MSIQLSSVRVVMKFQRIASITSARFSALSIFVWFTRSGNFARVRFSFSLRSCFGRTAVAIGIDSVITENSAIISFAGVILKPGFFFSSAIAFSLLRS